MTAQPLLPYDRDVQEAVDPLEALARRNVRLANLVESISRRRDVRRRRAQILLLLVERVCPVGCRPRRSWYVPGAVARMGPEGIRRVWCDRFGEEPPSERTVRSHLGTLESACAIQRAPGDFLPCRRSLEHPERRPRYPDTIHVLESDQAAAFWADEGEGRLERHPDARVNPHRWAMLFARWRAEAATSPLLEAAPQVPANAPPRLPVRPSEGGKGLDPSERDEDVARGVVALLRRAPSSPFAFVAALRELGVPLRGPVVPALLRDYDRLAGATALLALGLNRSGQRVRNRAGWLVRQFRHASPAELADALRAVLREKGLPPCRPRSAARPSSPPSAAPRA